MIFAEIQDAFPTIQEADKNYLCIYLDKLKAQSKNSFICSKGTLKQFYECVKVSICDLTYSDVNAYVNYLATYFSNNATKRGHLVRVKAYYHFVLKYLGAQGIYKHVNSASIFDGKNDGIFDDKNDCIFDITPQIMKEMDYSREKWKRNRPFRSPE